MTDTRHICVIGDVHGHLQLALPVAARRQLELKVQFDAVLLAGDVGTFPSIDDLDKATKRHAESNPCEIEFALQRMADPAPSHLDRIFAFIDDNGCGLLAPVVMITGNHEGFRYLETIVPSAWPEGPVTVDELPVVDAGGRVRLLHSGGA